MIIGTQWRYIRSGASNPNPEDSIESPTIAQRATAMTAIDNFISSSGLSYARNQYLGNNPYNEAWDSTRLTEEYLSWVERPAYILLQQLDPKHNKPIPNKYKVIRGAKRGDSQYARKTLNRFNTLEDKAKKLKLQCSPRFTQALFIGFTYAKQKDSNWKRVTSDWAKFMSRLRRRHGKIQQVRMLEAHKSGFVHLHAIIIFETRRFNLKKWYSRHREKHIYILRSEKQRQALKDLWPHGNMDIEGVYNLHGAIGYLTKYMTKLLTMELEHSAPHLAKLWVYRKRTYSVSQRLDSHLSNSNSEESEFYPLQPPPEDSRTQYKLIGVVTSDFRLDKRQIHDIQLTQSQPAVYHITYSKAVNQN